MTDVNTASEGDTADDSTVLCNVDLDKRGYKYLEQVKKLDVVGCWLLSRDVS